MGTGPGRGSRIRPERRRGSGGRTGRRPTPGLACWGRTHLLAPRHGGAGATAANSRPRVLGAHPHLAKSLRSAPGAARERVPRTEPRSHCGVKVGGGVKAVAMQEPGRPVLIDRPDPVPADDFVVVQIKATPICTEYKLQASGAVTDALGHEAAGEVVAVARPGRVRVGDRVAVMPQTWCGRCALCLAGDYIHCERAPRVATPTYAQYVRKQDALLVPIPDGLSYAHGAMACCGLGPTFGAMRRLGVRAPDSVLITGLGPVGLGGVINAAACGARVIAVEGQPYRARLACALGAAAVIDPRDPQALTQIRDLTGGGADHGIDCSGSAPAQRLLLDAVRRRGNVAFIGEAGDLTLSVSRDLLRKGLTLHGCWHYNLADTPRVMALIAELGAQLDRLITHTFPMSRVAEAWALQAGGACGKVVLDPWA